MIIEIDTIPIEIIQKPIKSMNLRVYPPNGAVKVSAPLNFSEQLIRRHLQNKITWIKTQRQRIQNNFYVKDEILQTGSKIKFMGNWYLLIIEEHNGPLHIKINDQLVHCHIKPNTSQIQLNALLEQWYRREMESILPELINKWQRIIGVTVNEWGIKKMKTRWGSCNTRVARIWLNLSLIQKPLLCLEYVLVHELIHLLEASHNKRFHALMTHFMPKWKEYKQILNDSTLCKTS